MEIVSAAAILTSLPRDLPALRMSVREGEPIARICAVGDIGLSGRAAATGARDGSDVLFADVEPLFHSADVVFGNLESPLAGSIAPTGNFAAPVSGAATLRQAGFRLIHLANNHVGEYGRTGLAATLAAVHQAGLLPLGAGPSRTESRRLVRTDVGDVRIGWLGCGRTLLPQDEGRECYWEFDEDELLHRIQESRSQVDVLIVSIHIGTMYVSYPRPEHKTMAERLMCAGADAIVMHHAHVLQGIQTTTDGRVCCYNLGNFLYDWEEGNVKVPVVLDQQNEGAVFVLDVDRRGVVALTVLPTWIDEDCRVRWATGDRGRTIVNRLTRISEELKSDFRAAYDRERAERNTGGMVRVLAFHVRHRNWSFVANSLRRLRWEHFKMALRCTYGAVVRPMRW